MKIKLLIGCGLLILLLFFSIVSIYPDWLWFKSLGFFPYAVDDSTLVSQHLFIELAVSLSSDLALLPLSFGFPLAHLMSDRGFPLSSHQQLVLPFRPIQIPTSRL